MGALLASALNHGEIAGTLLAAPLILLMAWGISRSVTQPYKQRIHAVVNAAQALREGDFSLEVRTGTEDELDQLAQVYNDLVEGVRNERLNINQREHLLNALVQSAPQSLLLLNKDGRIVLDNPAARKLFNCDTGLVGCLLGDELHHLPTALREALHDQCEGFVTVPGEDGDETYQLQRRGFSLQGQLHFLWQIFPVTRDTARQEIATWKKVIRIISHEVNNSLAPVSSMAHSALKLVERQEWDRVRDVLGGIADRSTHLSRFIDSYADFARVPQPQCEWVPANELLRTVNQVVSCVWDETEATHSIWADRPQLEQLLINLLKNAHEAGSNPSDVRLQLSDGATGTTLRILDCGRGMSESARMQALLPFFTTKPDGSGLGLAVVRDVVLAHDGRISLLNRKNNGASGTEVRVFLPKPA